MRTRDPWDPEKCTNHIMNKYDLTLLFERKLTRSLTLLSMSGVKIKCTYILSICIPGNGKVIHLRRIFSDNPLSSKDSAKG